MPTARGYAGSACIGNKVFFIGGYIGNSNCISRVEFLELQTNTWHIAANMLQEMLFPIVATIADKIYVIFNTHTRNKKINNIISLQCYDSVSDTWSYKAQVPHQITDTNGASAISVDRNIFIVGVKAKPCLQYTIATDTWTILSGTLGGHFYGSAIFINGTIMILGGQTNSIEEYDMNNNKWTVTNFKLPARMTYHHAVAL
jgi:hypothetical protein